MNASTIETLNAASGSVCNTACGVGFKYGQLILHHNWCYTDTFEMDGAEWTWDWCINKSVTEEKPSSANSWSDEFIAGLNLFQGKGLEIGPQYGNFRSPRQHARDAKQGESKANKNGDD